MVTNLVRWLGSAALCLLSSRALADGAVVSTNPPAYQQGNNSLSQTPTGGLRVQLQANGQDISPGVPGPLKPLASQQTLVLTGAAQSLTVPAGAKYADFFPEGTAGTNNKCLRFRDDGSAPTATVGSGLDPDQLYLGYSANLTAIQFIAASGATCTLTINYYQ